MAATSTATESGSAADRERAQLLTAARQVLDRSGWWGFKVESVLKQARLSTRSFYRHFQKKTDLLLALLELELGGAAVHLRRVTATDASPVDRLHAFIGATIDMAYREDLAKPSSLFAAHWRELLPEYPDVINECINLMVAPLTDAIRAGVKTGVFTTPDPVADAFAVFYLVASMTADQAALGGSTPRAELEHILLPFVARALGTGEPRND